MSGFKQTWRQSIGEASATPLEELMCLRYEGNAVYRYVKLHNATAGVGVFTGDAVAYFAATGAADGRVVSDWTDASAAPVLAGVSAFTEHYTHANDGQLSATDSQNGVYIWIQVRGPVKLLDLTGVVAAGNAIRADAANDTEATACSAHTDSIAGFALEANGTDQFVVLDCP